METVRSSAICILIFTVVDQPPDICPHFPNALHAVVWRNWPLAPTPTPILAKTLKTTPERVLDTLAFT
jgi:hypothetical protein